MPPDVRVGWGSALAWRLGRQMLAPRAQGGDVAGVAGRLCGLHAQVMGSAELSVLARAESLTPGAVQDALWRDRTVVKLWAVRGTLHLLPSADLAGWFAALRTMPKFGNAGDPRIDRICAAVDAALRGGILTRAELAAEVGRRTGDPELAGWIGSSWGTGLKAPSFRGLVCFAPPDGATVRFTSPRTWIPGTAEPPDAARGLREVVRRFVRAYAPVTPESLAQWWVGPPRAAIGAALLDTLGDEVAPVEIDGTTAYALADDVADLRAATAPETVRLLPAFDPFVLGAWRTGPYLPAPRHGDVFRPAGRVAPVVLVDGRIAGTWGYRNGNRVAVSVEPFGRPGRSVRDRVEHEAERIAGYFGHPLDLVWHA